ncbi:MAG: hypothetical protein IJV32_02870 [Bacteroidales bacterium]|nr:hypothetical protein [Bacteroidales bacterium]
MKALFVAYNQAYNREVIDLLQENGQRGYTSWEEISGRGTVDGEPHLGDHAWPARNHALLSVMEDKLAKDIFLKLKDLDADNPNLGLKAYILPVDESM